jgi:hypothetical protein
MKAKRCEQEEIPNYGIRVTFSKPVDRDPIYCASCCRPVNQDDPLFFAGGLGCDKCVHAHYEREDRALSTNRNFNESFESILQTALKFRRSHGARVLKQILQARSKEQTKRKRRRGWGQ